MTIDVDSIVNYVNDTILNIPIIGPLLNNSFGCAIILTFVVIILISIFDSDSDNCNIKISIYFFIVSSFFLSAFYYAQHMKIVNTETAQVVKTANNIILGQGENDDVRILPL